MPDALIRDVPPDDLDQIRAEAALRGESLQHYLRGVVHVQASHLRRQAAIARTAERLHGRPEVSDAERGGVPDDVARAHDERAERLGGRPPR